MAFWSLLYSRDDRVYLLIHRWSTFMAEPDNHRLRLLREIRSQGEATKKGLDDLQREMGEFRKEATQAFEHVGERLEHLTRLVTGESVLGRYAAANVDERIQALEQRVAALEDQR
jgi:polyhydroxyalkanoate synthesis regulator phasin